jgi:rsbT co-antagonist protein RsbR
MTTSPTYETVAEGVTEEWSRAIAALLAAVGEAMRGNLRARVHIPEDAPEALKALGEGVERLVGAWRASEIQARKTKRALEEKVATVEAQAVAIRELSTPIMQIWRDVLLMPLVGGLDAKRSADVTSALLERLTETQSRQVIIDVTGVEFVDEQTAEHLVRLVRAAKLLGARCVVTGVSPAVACTLVTIGADLGALTTLRTLEKGLQACLAPT